MWYFETYSDLSKGWLPTTRATKPPTITLGADLCLKRQDGRRPKIRHVQEVQVGHEEWTLDQLQAIYGEQKAEPPASPPATGDYAALFDRTERLIAYCKEEAKYLEAADSVGDEPGALYAKKSLEIAGTMQALLNALKGVSS